ncbi:helix-turn-helix domain-containing protein [Teredinibacter haidensis]|uniref:helix-turn-helix domain-containing protein n=1 Tax=Teredinibacter haidensis TaxID=2731755 RepID=UPI000948E73F|nr:RodZ domain-containing protein [Teredinibacter haidensis]
MTGSQAQLNIEDEYQQLLDQSKPGAALKLIREGKAVDIEAIASATMIPDWKLADLENDNYGGLGGELFVMGYIRKVAKILDVESDSLIAAYKQSVPSTMASSAEHVLGEPSLAGSGSIAMSTLSSNQKKSFLTKINSMPGYVAVAALLFVWVFAVWLIKPNKPVGELNSSPVAAVVAETETETVVFDAEVDVSENDAVDSPPQPPVLVPTSVPSAEPVAETPAPSDTRPGVFQNESLLVLSFIDDCWVKVTDANGKVVFAQTKLKGDNLQLFGEAPFKVMLGNARAAEVMINGQPFAVNPVPGKKTLRFTVAP